MDSLALSEGKTSTYLRPLKLTNLLPSCLLLNARRPNENVASPSFYALVWDHFLAGSNDLSHKPQVCFFFNTYFLYQSNRLAVFHASSIYAKLTVSLN